MSKYKLFVLTCIFFISFKTIIYGQSKFELPKNIELTSKEDYTKYEATYIEAAKWLEETELDKELEKRKEINSFILHWISGSPTITVDIEEPLGKVYGKNSQLLGLYLASYGRHMLENGSSATKFTATRAGLVSIMTVYKKGIEVSRSKEMEKLIKLTEENKLDEYIKGKFKL